MRGVTCASLLTGSVKCLPGLDSALGIVMKLSIKPMVLWSRARGSIPIFGGGKQLSVRRGASCLSR